jgi:uncharacterized membrane protein
MADPTPRRVRLLTALLLLGTFLAGGAAGAGVMWLSRPLVEPCAPPPPPMPMPFHRLGLSADQTKAVQAIMDRHRPQLEAILKEGFPKVRAIHEAIDREVRPLLTDGQRRQLDELRARRPPGPPPPFGPPPPGPPPPAGHRP